MPVTAAQMEMDLKLLNEAVDKVAPSCRPTRELRFSSVRGVISKSSRPRRYATPIPSQDFCRRHLLLSLSRPRALLA